VRRRKSGRNAACAKAKATLTRIHINITTQRRSSAAKEAAKTGRRGSAECESETESENRSFFCWSPFWQYLIFIYPKN